MTDDYMDIKLKIYEQLGLSRSIFDTPTTATEAYQREVYRHLYGKYPEENLLDKSIKED